MKTSAFTLLMMGFVISCSSDDTTDIRKNFLRNWSLSYELTCTPPGTTTNDTEGLEITKGDGSSKIQLSFEGGLTLTATVLGENLFSINETVATIDYSGTGTFDNGSIEFLLTYSVGGSYCVKDGVAD
jgi:hypothetical protein